MKAWIWYVRCKRRIQNCLFLWRYCKYFIWKASHDCQQCLHFILSIFLSDELYDPYKGMSAKVAPGYDSHNAPVVYRTQLKTIKWGRLTSLKKFSRFTNNIRIPSLKLSLTLAVYRILSTQLKADGIFKANTV